MPDLFRRHSNIQCFFCHSPLPLPKNPRNFRCPSCACWNRYDDNGEILSDEPAMHDEHLNSRSFAKRASPSKDRLPTSYGPGPFCHNCQTNQMLLVNLLSNYLPPPESPEYQRRLEMLPAYRESLHLRYPPVCESCLPLVEEEIQKKDQMARTKALGAWLKDSKGKERQRRVSGAVKGREKITVEILFWRLRGFLWISTIVLSIVVNSRAALGHPISGRLWSLQAILPLFILISLLWTAWDPTYLAFRKAQLQGRDIRIHGKSKYITYQLIGWLSRFITSVALSLCWFNPQLDYLHFVDPASLRNRTYFTTMLLIEIIAFISSCLVLRVQQPPAIRLLNTNTHQVPSSRSATPNPGTRAGTPSFLSNKEPDLLASLSLSSKPVITSSNPVFGLPSLLSPSNMPASVPHEDNEDGMDWTPTNMNGTPYNSRAGRDTDEAASWLRPQQFFAPEKPTGLEGLFERTKLEDDAMRVDGSEQQRNIQFYVGSNMWYLVCLTLLVVPSVGVAYKLLYH